MVPQIRPELLVQSAKISQVDFLDNRKCGLWSRTPHQPIRHSGLVKELDAAEREGGNLVDHERLLSHRDRGRHMDSRIAFCEFFLLFFFCATTSPFFVNCFNIVD